MPPSVRDEKKEPWEDTEWQKPHDPGREESDRYTYDRWLEEHQDAEREDS